jgi:putative ABC transport system ATP-binding protein
MAIIELQDISKLYGFGDATTVALDEINLSIEKGEFVAVMGASGSGKSTLMNIIGLLDRPTHGNYALNGKQVARLRANQRARNRRDKIGFVFQSFNLLPRMTVIENVALPLAYKGLTLSRRLKRASLLLERVGLQDREYFLPQQLSGGQAQRVAIARALVTTPDILIADEPTGNLDSSSSRLVMELLSEVHQSGHTIILVTHNPELTRYANRVVYMQDGAIVHDEITEVGKVPRRARSIISRLPRTTEEDDFAGVSVLMSALDQTTDDIETPKRTKKAKKTKRQRKKTKAEVKSA